MTRPAININDVPKETAKKLGLAKKRDRSFSKDHVRGWALKILAEMSALTQDQRRRVLDHAKKVNSL
jgi:hypothetical protein